SDGASVLAISALSADKAEGNGGGTTPFTFTVTRAGGTSGASSVSWQVGAGASPSADGGDFSGGVLPSGTVNFAAGDTSKTITVNVVADATVEHNENFVVTLSNATGASIDPQHTSANGVIHNDDPTPAFDAATF